MPTDSCSACGCSWIRDYRCKHDCAMCADCDRVRGV